MEKFNILWQGFEYAVIATRKEIKDFADQHANNYGNILIFVRGCGRYVHWKSIGAGLYRVYTTEEV